MNLMNQGSLLPRAPRTTYLNQISSNSQFREYDLTRKLSKPEGLERRYWKNLSVSKLLSCLRRKTFRSDLLSLYDDDDDDDDYDDVKTINSMVHWLYRPVVVAEFL